MSDITNNASRQGVLLTLASGSRYRQQQLEQLQLPFSCHPADVDETPYPGEPADKLAARLARAKAAAIAEGNTGIVVIGCDQVASCENRVLGKPGTVPNAIEQLRFCADRTVIFHSALCVWDTRSQQVLADSVVTEVKFRPLKQEQITQYIHKEDPLDCAGSFKCEGLGIALFQWIRSEDPSALIGLPLIRLTDFLAECDIHPL